MHKLYSALELCQQIASHAKQRRIALKLRQIDVANAAGVTLSTIKRFERTGKVGLDIVAAVAVALDAAHEFTVLFPIVEPQTFAQAISTKSTIRVRYSSK